MPKYSPDIAGIISCLCESLIDEVHGVEGCVIESSDNDHHDGEILIEIADDHGGTGPYVIKIAHASVSKIAPETRTASLTVDVTYDPQVTDAESIASAADRLLETALSTPGILEEYGSPTFDSFYVASNPT